MIPAAFMFDLDGTLIDSESAWVRAILSWMAENGVAENPETISRHVFGHSWPDIHAYLHAAHPELPPTTIAEDSASLRRHHDLLGVKPEDEKIESSCEFFLKCAEIAPCCIVSGSPRADVLKYAETCGVAGKLAFALGPEDYARGKPAPDGFLAAAKRLGAEPAQCVVIEDSTPGVASGVAAGMCVWGLNRSPSVAPDFTGCELVVSDLLQINLDELRS